MTENDADKLMDECNYEQALPILQQILKINPGNPRILLKLGDAMIGAGINMHDCINIFNQVLAIDHNNVMATDQMMLCYDELGDEQKAKEWGARLVQIAPEKSSYVKKRLSKN